MNAPPRYDSFVLGDDEKKLVPQEEAKISNAATFTFNKEDHTLANMLRAQLLLNPNVIFAGYRVPHPLEPRVEIKVQTDGEKTPHQVLRTATEELILVLAETKKQFKGEVLKARARGDGGDDGYGAGMEVEGGGVSGW